MKITLPNGKSKELPKDIDLNQKIELSQQLTEEWLEVCSQKWTSKNVKLFLNGLADYILWHDDSESAKPEGYLSKNQVEIMNRRSDKKRKELPYSNLENVQEKYNEDQKMKNDINKEVAKAKEVNAIGTQS